jgi:hypothetical protein
VLTAFCTTRAWLTSIHTVATVLLLATGVSGASQGTFRKVPASESHITWKHNNAMSKDRFLPEIEPPGVAIFDYDNDGWMDILIVNSGEAEFFHPKERLHHALYRNNGNGTFTDVTEAAGIVVNIFGMGVATGDYDSDGFQDVLITGYGRVVLYHNEGNGTFQDITTKSGIHAPGWSTAGVWFDYNNDGKLDLFVSQFVDYSSLKVCGIENSYGGKMQGVGMDQTFYCIPRIFDPTTSYLFRNEGGGHFTDVSKETGITKSLSKGFGVVATDINMDGFLDLFQANDTVANYLFMNREGKKFEEVGLAAGVGYSEDGAPRSGMGVDAADVDGDGWPDLFVANIDQETFSIYHNNGDDTFDDYNKRSGIADATRLLSGWGVRFFDYDNDGLLDLIIANGHPDDLVDRRSRGVTFQEPLRLFHNDGRGKMVDVSNQSGEVFLEKHSARGLATGDLNNDGYPDVVVGVNGDAPLLLYNNGESKHNWIGLQLEGKTANPAATGAVIKWSVNGIVRSMLKAAGGSFMSTRDPREIIGLGDSQRVDWLEIRWPKPSTRVDRFSNLSVNRYYLIPEGTGIRDQ